METIFQNIGFRNIQNRYRYPQGQVIENYVVRLVPISVLHCSHYASYLPRLIGRKSQISHIYHVFNDPSVATPFEFHINV